MARPLANLREPRNYLNRLYQAALNRVEGGACVVRALPEHILGVSTRVVAIGKAASAMTRGAYEALDKNVEAALVITKYGHLPDEIPGWPGIETVESGHPLPDEASLEAGRRLLAFLQCDSGDAQLLFLISGGASSLVEVLRPGVDLALLRRANRWLIGNDFNISQINQVRKALSRIKGGGLLQYLNGRRTGLLAISDVPGDGLEDIGSGLLSSAVHNTALPPLPDWLGEALANSPPARAGQVVTTTVIASNADARAAVRAAAGDACPVWVSSELLGGPAAECGRKLARKLLADAPVGVYVWGGETTVELPCEPGRGGRCQHLALAAAIELAGHDGIFLLAAGTDGTDGPTEDAGAVVDGGTLSRGSARMLDANQCLVGADAGSFLEASGDLIRVGPTGTNVMDLVIGLKCTA